MSQRPPAHGVGRDDLLTKRQLDAIVALATRRGLDANEMAQEAYRRQVVDLSVREAGVLIKRLQGMQVTHASMGGFTLTNQPLPMPSIPVEAQAVIAYFVAQHDDEPILTRDGVEGCSCEGCVGGKKLLGAPLGPVRKPPSQVTTALKDMD